MKNVCVITGGGSGMGFSAAKFIDPKYQLLLTGRTVSKLEGAKSELEGMGFTVTTASCDVSDRESVKDLVKLAQSLGDIKAVIHAAGVSPTMGDANYIFDINAIGTINVNDEFASIMSNGGSIVDVSSMSAYMMPEESLPKQLYPLALRDPQAFKKQMEGVFSSVPEESAPGYSYSVSKNFVIWYAQQSALRFGKKRSLRGVGIPRYVCHSDGPCRRRPGCCFRRTRSSR